VLRTTDVAQSCLAILTTGVIYHSCCTNPVDAESGECGALMNLMVDWE